MWLPGNELRVVRSGVSYYTCEFRTSSVGFLRFMRAVLETLIAIPTPLILMVVTGLVFWRRRRLSFVLIATATILLVGLSLPVVAKMLARPLAAGAISPVKVTTSESVAVLVPTAGIFRDSNGRWWSTASGIERAVTGQRLSQKLKLPLIFSGGAPGGESEPEAKILATQIGLDASDVILETEAKNSYETARGIVPIVTMLGGDHILLVTSPTHVARMAASLRRQGLEVSAVAAGLHHQEASLGRITDFLPSAAGMGQSRAAIHEYLAILFYLVQGHIRTFDLVL